MNVPTRLHARRQAHQHRRKGNRLPGEAGLRLLKQPSVPREIPATLLIRNQFSMRDWEHFLLKK